MLFNLIGFVTTIALFVVGLVAALLLSELKGLNTPVKRDGAYLALMIVVSLMIWGFNGLSGLDIHAISFVCGVLGGAVWDEFFSEEHGRFRHNRDPRNPEGLNPAEHQDHQPFAG